MWCIYNLPYKSALSFHKHPSPVVDYPDPSVPDIAHPYKIPGVDNQYNRQSTSIASPASILISTVEQLAPAVGGLGHPTFLRLSLLRRQVAEALDFGLFQLEEFIPGVVIADDPGDPVDRDHKGRAIHVFPGDVHRVRFRLKMCSPPGPEDRVEFQLVEFIPGQLQEFHHFGFIQALVAIIERVVFHIFL